MRLDEFDYELPEALIAQEPLADRSGSRLLHVDRASGAVVHRMFQDCIGLLEAGDLLVMNDTRVTARRVFGEKPTGGRVELLLLREVGPETFWCLAKPGRRLQVGASVVVEGMKGEVLEVDGEGLRLVEFEAGSGERLKSAGEVPLPPYVHFKLDDEERYQTVYSSSPGSAAAPTAGLHFTPEILDELGRRGVGMTRVTLDVSLDTFRPVTAETVADHTMHGEVCRVGEAAAAAVNGCTGRVVAVGTTSVRTLESFAAGRGRVEPGEMLSKLFISPGYEFLIVDGMFTNFHLPKTTMLLMLAAMVGPEVLKSAYREAVESRYRFLSFGDSMLIL